MATVLAFPPHRRRDLVRRQAAWFLEQGPRAAEANLYRQMQVQRDTLLSKGVDPAAVDGAVARLREAIMAEAVHLYRSRGGAA